MIEGSGSGAIHLTNVSGSGSRRPKNMSIRIMIQWSEIWIRIRWSEVRIRIIPVVRIRDVYLGTRNRHFPSIPDPYFFHPGSVPVQKSLSILTPKKLLNLPKCSETSFIQEPSTRLDNSHISLAMICTPRWETPKTGSSRARKLPYVSLGQKNICTPNDKW